MTRAIAWDNAPNTAETRQTYEMIRCPATSTGPWLITAADVIGVQVYWMAGRSQPHILGECPGCLENKPHRWCGWIAVYDERRMRHCILEISPLCIGTINDFKLAQGTLRGARITLRRPSGKKNGRIVAELQASGLTLPQIPETFDMTAELTRLWDAPNRRQKPALETPRATMDIKPPQDKQITTHGIETANAEKKQTTDLMAEFKEAKKKRAQRNGSHHEPSNPFAEAAANITNS